MIEGLRRVGDLELRNFVYSHLKEHGELLGKPKVKVGKAGEILFYNVGSMKGTRITTGDIYTTQKVYVAVGNMVGYITHLRPSIRTDL